MAPDQVEDSNSKKRSSGGFRIASDGMTGIPSMGKSIGDYLAANSTIFDAQTSLAAAAGANIGIGSTAITEALKFQRDLGSTFNSAAFQQVTDMVSKLQPDLGLTSPYKSLFESGSFSALQNLHIPSILGDVPNMFANQLDVQKLIGGDAMRAITALSSDQLGITKFSKMFNGGLAGSQLTALSQTTALASLMGTNNYRYRMASIFEGFERQSASPLDGYGEAHNLVATNPELDAAVEHVLALTQKKSSFGLDYKGVADGVRAVESELEKDPELEHELRRPLLSISEATGLDDEIVLEYSEILGWWQRVRPRRISGAGLVLGYTVGLAAFLAGTLAMPLPPSLVEALIAGGGVYGAVSRREKETEAPKRERGAAED